MSSKILSARRTHSSDRPRRLDSVGTLVKLSVAASPVTSRATYTPMKPSRSRSGTPGWPRKCRSSNATDRGSAPSDRRHDPDTASQVRRDRRSPWNRASRHRVTRQPRQPRTQTGDKRQSFALAPVSARYHVELVVTTFLGTPTLPHWRSRCSGMGGHVCCQIAAKNDQDPFFTSPKGLWLGLL